MTNTINPESWFHKIQEAEQQDPDSQFVLVDRKRELILKSADTLREIYNFFRTLGADTHELWFGRTSKSGYFCKLTTSQQQKLIDMDSGTTLVDVKK